MDVWCPDVGFHLIPWGLVVKPSGLLSFRLLSKALMCRSVSVVVWREVRQVYGFMLWGLDRVSEHSHPRQDRKNILCEQELGNSASERLKLFWKLHTSSEHVLVARESSQAIYGNPHHKVVLKNCGIWESKCGQWKSLSVSLSLSCHALSFSSSLPYL